MLPTISSTDKGRDGLHFEAEPIGRGAGDGHDAREMVGEHAPKCVSQVSTVRDAGHDGSRRIEVVSGPDRFQERSHERDVVDTRRMRRCVQSSWDGPAVRKSLGKHDGESVRIGHDGEMGDVRHRLCGHGPPVKRDHDGRRLQPRRFGRQMQQIGSLHGA